MLKPLGILQVSLSTITLCLIVTVLILTKICLEDIHQFLWVLLSACLVVLAGGILIACGLHDRTHIHAYVFIAIYTIFGVIAVAACGFSIWMTLEVVRETDLESATSKPTVTNLETTTTIIDATNSTTKVPDLEESASAVPMSTLIAIRMTQYGSFSDTDPQKRDYSNTNRCLESTVINVLSTIVVLFTFSMGLLSFLIAYRMFDILKKRNEYDTLHESHRDETTSGREMTTV